MSEVPAQPSADHIGRAILLTLVTIAVFGVQDAISKLLVQSYSPFQTTMMRFWGFAAFSLMLVLRQAPLRQALSSKVPLWQVLRGTLLIVEIWCFARALQTVPLAELQAISLVYPLMVTLFAIPILGEQVGVFRLVAVAVGFAGAMVIVRPGGLPLDWGVLFALASAALYSLYIVITRKVSQHDTATTSMAYTGFVGLLLSSGVGVFFWQPMAWTDVALVLTIMVTTCVGHGLMVLALALAPASVVQPFNYFSLPWAIFLSVLVFGHMIDFISLLGAAVIVAAGLVVMARERWRKRGGTEVVLLPGKE
jgi:drug/metabolite transporter (DMT)-like permease